MGVSSSNCEHESKNLHDIISRGLGAINSRAPKLLKIPEKWVLQLCNGCLDLLAGTWLEQMILKAVHIAQRCAVSKRREQIIKRKKKRESKNCEKQPHVSYILLRTLAESIPPSELCLRNFGTIDEISEILEPSAGLNEFSPELASLLKPIETPEFFPIRRTKSSLCNLSMLDKESTTSAGSDYSSFTEGSNSD
eukprot:GEMP01046476.1.p1 GENE.GEMP01046476.1~~GEMP01046476.1.p1  ORF type:complete len:194 (+),score=34.92 GEMP01046476.1:29-610(+)